MLSPIAAALRRVCDARNHPGRLGTLLVSIPALWWGVALWRGQIAIEQWDALRVWAHFTSRDAVAAWMTAVALAPWIAVLSGSIRSRKVAAGWLCCTWGALLIASLASGNWDRPAVGVCFAGWLATMNDVLRQVRILAVLRGDGV